MRCYICIVTVSKLDGNTVTATRTVLYRLYAATYCLVVIDLKKERKKSINHGWEFTNRCF